MIVNCVFCNSLQWSAGVIVLGKIFHFHTFTPRTLHFVKCAGHHKTKDSWQYIQLKKAAIECARYLKSDIMGSKVVPLITMCALVTQKLTLVTL